MNLFRRQERTGTYYFNGNKDIFKSQTFIKSVDKKKCLEFSIMAPQLSKNIVDVLVNSHINSLRGIYIVTEHNMGNHIMLNGTKNTAS